MAINVECNWCGRKSQMPDDKAGSKAECPFCGIQFQIPAGGKVCAGCGLDVSRRHRTKDDSGNYYCASCWKIRQEGGETPNPVAAKGTGYICAVCATTLAERTFYYLSGDLLCEKCYRKVDKQHQTPLVQCHTCHAVATSDHMHIINRKSICEDCFRAREAARRRELSLKYANVGAAAMLNMEREHTHRFRINKPDVQRLGVWMISLGIFAILLPSLGVDWPVVVHLGAVRFLIGTILFILGTLLLMYG